MSQDILVELVAGPVDDADAGEIDRLTQSLRAGDPAQSTRSTPSTRPSGGQAPEGTRAVDVAAIGP